MGGGREWKECNIRGLWLHTFLIGLLGNVMIALCLQAPAAANFAHQLGCPLQ